MSPAGRPEAADVIWQARSEQPTEAPPRAGRNRAIGLVQGAAVGVIGALLWQHWSHVAGSVALGVGTLIFASALVSPLGLYVGIQRLFAALGYQTKRLLTWLLLVPLFYLFFVPFGTLLRRGRRDRMKRRFEADAESYWEPHPTTLTPRAYDRQY